MDELNRKPMPFYPTGFPDLDLPLHWPSPSTRFVFGFEPGAEQSQNSIALSVEQPDDRELFVRKSITQYTVMDDGGEIFATYDTFEEAAADLDTDKQVIELTGTGFVRA